MRSTSRGGLKVLAATLLCFGLVAGAAPAAQASGADACAAEGLDPYYFPRSGVSSDVIQCGNAAGELVLVNLTEAVVAVRDSGMSLDYPDWTRDDWDLFQTNVAAIDSSVIPLFPGSKMNVPEFSDSLVANADFQLTAAYAKFLILQNVIRASEPDDAEDPGERLADFLLSYAAGACVKAAYKSSEFAIAAEEASDLGDVLEVTRDSLKIPKVWKKCKAEWKSWVKTLTSSEETADLRLSKSFTTTLKQRALTVEVAGISRTANWWRPLVNLFH